MLKQFFSLDEYKTNVRTEVLAGITSFLSCSYIIFVNPMILSQAGIPTSAVATSTILASCLASVIMGLFANMPIVLAPGMGLNAFFVFTIVLGLKLDWHQALGLVFASGTILTLLSMFKIREKIIDAIPLVLRYATSAGIGLFISTIGLMNAGVIKQHPVTMITHAHFEYEQYVFLLGLFFTAILLIKKIKGALIYGIIATASLVVPFSIVKNTASLPANIFSTPDFQGVFALKWNAGFSLALLPILFSMMFTDLFDTLSTFVGVAEAGDLKEKDGRPRNLTRALIADSLATFISGPMGTSSTTSYIESAAGVQAGGRTGLTAIVAGLLFLPFLFCWPLIAIIPKVATAPCLVLVGVFMMAPIAKIHWEKMEEALPTFLNLIMIPLGYSITMGIVWGFLSYLVVQMVQKKWSEIPISLWIMGAFSILALVIH